MDWCFLLFSSLYRICCGVWAERVPAPCQLYEIYMRSRPDQPMTMVVALNESSDLLFYFSKPNAMIIALRDAFDESFGPFRMNFYYGKFLILNGSKWWKSGQTVANFSFMWRSNELVRLEKVAKSESNSMSIRFHFSKLNEPSQVLELCLSPNISYYWHLAKECTKITLLPPQFWLLLYKRPFLYMFFDRFILILPERIMKASDGVQHLVRYSKLNYDQFVKCKKLSFWREVVLFHRNHYYIYFIYLIHFLIGVYFIRCLTKSSVGPSAAKPDQYEYDWFWDNETFMIQTGQSSSDDELRALPVLCERPKFLMTSQTNFLKKISKGKTPERPKFPIATTEDLGKKVNNEKVS